MNESMADRVVNDFSINIATPNGTGSQTSNTVILRSLFHMGIAPVAKNMFPSNIQGLPTWYQFRVSPEAWSARREAVDILVVMNPATALQDIEKHRPGGVIIDNADYKIPDSRFEGFVRYSVPIDSLVLKEVRDAKLRPKLKNLVYVGILAELFGIPDDAIRTALQSMFPGKDAIVDVNMVACELGRSYTRDNLEKRDPYVLEPAEQTHGKILIDGNQAAALGAIFGGCSFVSWYPITPSSSVVEGMLPHLRKLRVDEQGGNRYVVLQAEDELAAIGMALGAGWAGARAMTSTSGPGISLMAENLGFGFIAEIPCVIYDVQRVGPSTGLPTRTQQGDLLEVATLSHGDTVFPMLFPYNPTECFELAWRAFDIAHRYQTPIFLMLDLDVGMNDYVCDPLQYPDRPLDHGKVLTDEMLASEEFREWGRYKDIDGDGIPYRTIPGRNVDPRAAFFTRGSGHDEHARYTEDEGAYERMIARVNRKVQGTVNDLPEPIFTGNVNADFGVIACGTTHCAVEEVLAETNGEVAYLRVRAFPFGDAVRDFIANRERILIVEQNYQGQLTSLLRQTFPEHATKLTPACYYGGLPISSDFVRRSLKDHFALV